MLGTVPSTEYSVEKKRFLYGFRKIDFNSRVPGSKVDRQAMCRVYSVLYIHTCVCKPPAFRYQVTLTVIGQESSWINGVCTP